MVLAEFQKAVRDAEELKEGLEGCRKLLSDMCKEAEQQTIVDKGRPHGPEYEVEDHSYSEDHRATGMQQPEQKKVRRGVRNPPPDNGYCMLILTVPTASRPSRTLPQLS